MSFPAGVIDLAPTLDRETCLPVRRGPAATRQASSCRVTSTGNLSLMCEPHSLLTLKHALTVRN